MEKPSVEDGLCWKLGLEDLLFSLFLFCDNCDFRENCRDVFESSQVIEIEVWKICPDSLNTPREKGMEKARLALDRIWRVYAILYYPSWFRAHSVISFLRCLVLDTYSRVPFTDTDLATLSRSASLWHLIYKNDAVPCFWFQKCECLRTHTHSNWAPSWSPAWLVHFRLIRHNHRVK